MRNALLEHRPRPIISVNALFQIFLTKQVWVGEFYLISENNHPSAIIHQPSSIIHQPSYISHHTSAIIHQRVSFYNKPQRRWWRRGLIVYKINANIWDNQINSATFSGIASTLPAIVVNLTSNGSQLYQEGKSTFSGDMTDTRNVVTKVTDHRSQLSKLWFSTLTRILIIYILYIIYI